MNAVPFHECRYWFLKNMSKSWLPVGATFKTFISDIKRVWPGPGVTGLKLLQVGVSVNPSDIQEPHITVRDDNKWKA